MASSKKRSSEDATGSHRDLRQSHEDVRIKGKEAKRRRRKKTFWDSSDSEEEEEVDEQANAEGETAMKIIPAAAASTEKDEPPCVP